MNTQTITVIIDDKQQQLAVEKDTYNDKPVYYLVDEDIETRLNGVLPNNLVLTDTSDGVRCSPRVITIEGQQAIQSIWAAIKEQFTDTPQPFGPGLG
ncbi:hypothetical protein [Chitinophaga sp. MD30]|uniref:hypothetical protein n=1 Tax=Chitinophaga sp. MD30 TaxID=2033437 RepID=UPI000BAF6982|nr:hypothetical protein [Chitinophaga sp. MD30]ASZ11246.1 hypothetical protein CK934_09850 [Chitinophaga sp. MD30]